MSRYPFQAKQLSYGYISFVPYCDPDTLYLHHNRYYPGAEIVQQPVAQIP